MIWRSLAVACILAWPANAQQAQTLADIRQELTVLYVEIQRLKTQLSTTGAPSTGVSGNTVLERVNSIERELQRLTSVTEQLEFRVGRVVKDGTNRVGDLEFRLCELEANCDIGSLGDTPSLGGGDVPSAPSAPAASDTPQFAVGEQGDFDRAKAAFDAGNFAEAADAFERFSQVYSGGTLATEALFLRGQALGKSGQWQPAARAYLEAFSSNPASARAPDALLQLGKSLAELGQSGEACLTLSEVEVRYPNSSAVLEAKAEMRSNGCS